MLQKGTYNLVATGLHAASLFLSVSLIARFCSPAALGDYVLAYAVSAPVYMFLNSRLRVVLANNVELVDPTWNFVRFRIITSAIAWLLIAIAALTFAPAERATIIILVALFKAAEAVGDVCGGALQRLQRLSDVQTAIILRALLTMAALGLVIPMTHSVVAAAAAISAVWILSCAAFLMHLWKINPPDKVDAPPTAVWVTASKFYRLGFTALLSSVAYNVPRYFLAAQGDDSALGYYGAIAYVSVMLAMIAYAISDATIPPLTYRYRDNLFSPSYLKDVHFIYIVIAIFGLLAFGLTLLAGPAILGLAFGYGYEAYSAQFAVMILAGTFNAFCICQEHTVVALQETQTQLLAIVCSFVLLIIVSTLLVPRFGIWGAVLSDLSYSLVYFVTVEWIIGRRKNLKLAHG